MPPTDMIQAKSIDVFIMDMLCMTPFYDHYLTKGLSEYEKVSVALGSISFHLDTNYFGRHSVPLQAGIIDIVAKFGISHKLIRQSLKFIEYIGNLLVLRLQFVLKRPDIVHVQWLPLIATTSLELWFLRSVQKQGAKIVHTVHNTLPHDSGDRHLTTYARLYKTADALICHTAAAKSELIEQFGIASDRICVIPHGPLFHEAKRVSLEDAKTRLGIPLDRAVVLLFGLLRSYKGAEFLLDAWKRVIEKDGKTLLIIAGNGEPFYLEKLNMRIAELQLGDTVMPCFRFIKEEEVSTYFSAADILVYPYKEITQSGALLTGMSFGKAIVATSLDGFVETLESGRCGVLVPYGKPELLADALVDLIKDPERRKTLGGRVAEVVRTRYSWENIAARTIECYRSALDRP